MLLSEELSTTEANPHIAMQCMTTHLCGLGIVSVSSCDNPKPRQSIPESIPESFDVFLCILTAALLSLSETRASLDRQTQTHTHADRQTDRHTPRTHTHQAHSHLHTHTPPPPPPPQGTDCTPPLPSPSTHTRTHQSIKSSNQRGLVKNTFLVSIQLSPCMAIIGVT